MQKDSAVTYSPVRLTQEEKQVLRNALEKMESEYDPVEKMLLKKLKGFNYHTDARSGMFHAVRPSLAYAIVLLDADEEQYRERAFQVIAKVISLQDTGSSSRTRGIWPYYLEEPLATKKTPPDFNWADFNGVSLLDILMTHEAELPDTLKPVIKRSLILAARAIMKRNMGPGYTNISLMGSYVTFMTAHLFDLPDMKEYARKRLETFYHYTLQLGGFSEYNSPDYTLVALDVLERMKMHIIDPEAKPMIDSLYNMGWSMIARHYHQPSAQWAGPHSRSYITLVEPSFYALLRQASGGKIQVAVPDSPQVKEKIPNLKIKHSIPPYLLHYFLQPDYPRTETDTLSIDAPYIVGTTYLTDRYVISTASRSLLWNQRRPFLAYWGNADRPHYLQLRFLHDGYDFSSAVFYGVQKENSVLAAVNFITNGGDQHVSSFFKLKEAKFKAHDLRLRFELGNDTDTATLAVPAKADQPFSFTIDSVSFHLQLYRAVFGKNRGYWQAGRSGNTSWVDYVIYSGQETTFDLNNMTDAIFGFTFYISKPGDKEIKAIPGISVRDSTMQVKWNGLELNAAIRPGLNPGNL